MVTKIRKVLIPGEQNTRGLSGVMEIIYILI